ncbi:MAG TPA: pantoate--beta-alanine ligase [Acidimicrobiales bacterium]|nr:pantoate--beta-alanine ligase [Acidimicrobiales bacterium]
MSSQHARLIDRSELVRKELDAARASGFSVGFVPTMGALHEGHLSLIRRAVAENDVTAVSIFVNPLQFGSPGDLVGYPRNLDGDLSTAADAGADLVFAPSVEEMYPGGGRTAASVRVEGLSEGFEGASRPGHFDGVATVVAKLFNLAGACRAYFGEKDYQQLLVVRRVVTDLSFPIEVVGCPTVREADGLACSSRNVRLSGANRAAATVLYRALTQGQAMIEGGVQNAAAIRASMAATVATEPRAGLDYAEVVDALTLQRLEQVTGEARLLVAACFDDIRLIDNLGVSA